MYLALYNETKNDSFYAVVFISYTVNFQNSAAKLAQNDLLAPENGDICAQSC